MISGSRGISQIGTGALTLTAVNTYSGVTTIASGAQLILAGGAGIASSSVVDNGVLNIAAPTATPQIQSLAGSGTVSLGAQTLQLTNASGNFAGVIAGTGGLILGGGTQTLSGISSYAGATQINGGTLTVTGSRRQLQRRNRQCRGHAGGDRHRCRCCMSTAAVR